MAEFNILFTSVGRRVSLVRAFRRSLEREKINHRLVGADLFALAPASLVVDKFFPAPRVDAPEYIPELMEICAKEKIDLVVPLIDTELLTLAKNREAFSKIGVTAMISSPETVEIAMDKLTTSDFFRSHNLSAVRTIPFEDQDWRKRFHYPMVLKPAKGSASVGVSVVKNDQEMEVLARSLKEPLVQEHIRGREYTTDLLIDAAGKVVAAVPRLRIEVRAGEVSKGVTVRHKKLIEFVTQCAQALPGAFGVVNVQTFEDAEGDLYVSEINPRFGGGFPLSYHAGADFPWWLYLMLKGKLDRSQLEGWQEGMVMLRYDDELIFKADSALYSQLVSKPVK